jgi:hypothetical protein
MSRNKTTVYGIILVCVAIAVSAILTASCVKSDSFAMTGFEKDESSALADPARRYDLAFVITGSTAGDFEPCGCGGVYEGGLSRRSTMIDKLKKTQPNIVLVDTGDLTCGGEAVQLEYLAQAYQALKYDAIALGEGDLRVGLDDFNKYSRKNKLPIVASNVKFKVPTEVREIIPVERAGIRMAIISVISERWLGIVPEPSRREIIYESPEKTLARLVPQLKKDYDAVILLSHLGTNEREKLKGKLTGIDLWIDNGGHQWTSMSSTQPSQLIQAGFRMMEQDPPLLVSWNNDRKIGIAGVTWKDRRFAINVAQLVPVAREIKEDPRYLEIYDAYKYISRQEAINRIMNPSAAIAGRPAHGFPYESSATCGSCHQEIYDFWKTTKHAHAYATIQKDNRDADSNCLACHTTGFREPGGFEHVQTTPQFKDVGCQMCHRVDLKKHHKRTVSPEIVKLEKIRAKSNDTTASWQCQRCHVPHRSPKYNYVEYLKKIKCTQALDSAKK